MAYAVFFGILAASVFVVGVLICACIWCRNKNRKERNMEQRLEKVEDVILEPPNYSESGTITTIPDCIV